MEIKNELKLVLLHLHTHWVAYTIAIILSIIVLFPKSNIEKSTAKVDMSSDSLWRVRYRAQSVQDSTITTVYYQNFYQDNIPFNIGDRVLVDPQDASITFADSAGKSKYPVYILLKETKRYRVQKDE